MLEEAVVEVEDVVGVLVGGFLVEIWAALDGFMWRATSNEEIGETFGPFHDPEVAFASAWQWLKDGNLA